MTPQPPIARACPLTVIGGFLGAGKTTLVNHLLANARGRYAVLVNDFGAVNVDAEIILAHDGETLRLTNGCVCCGMNDDFVGTLIRVLDAPDRFDHVVIEASGVGDPWSIAEIALVEPQLSLNAVIVLADAERIGALLDDPRLGDTVKRQIKAADLLLLNKIDLVDGAGRRQAIETLGAVKPGLRIVPTIAARIPDTLVDLIADETDANQPPPSRFRAQAADHETLFHRILYRRRGPFERERLETALRDMPPSLLRLKGRCAVDDETILLQLVGQRWSLKPADRSDAGWPIELVGIATEAGAAAVVAALLDTALAQDSHVASPARLSFSRTENPFIRDFED